MRTGFRIGQGVVMVFKIVSASSGNCLQLMVFYGVREMLSGSSTGVVEHIVG